MLLNLCMEWREHAELLGTFKPVTWKDQHLQVLLEPWITWILGLLQAHGDSQTGVQLSVNLHLLQ